MSALEKSVYRFGGFGLRTGERRLSDSGRAISLTPKVFDTLLLLVERADDNVSKDELMKALRPRGFVGMSPRPTPTALLVYSPSSRRPRAGFALH